MIRAAVLSLCVFAGMAAATGTAMAADAVETVRSFYAPEVWNPLESDDLSRLTGPALTLFQKSAAAAAEGGEMGCIDFVVTVGGQDYDDEEVAKTIRAAETGRTPEGDTQVTARFRAFPDATAEEEIRWTMRDVDGAWKVADIESPADDWKLSTFPCAN